MRQKPIMEITEEKSINQSIWVRPNGKLNRTTSLTRSLFLKHAGEQKLVFFQLARKSEYIVGRSHVVRICFTGFLEWSLILGYSSLISILVSNQTYLQELENMQVNLKFMHTNKQKYATKPKDHNKAEEFGESRYEFMKFIRVQQGCLQVKQDTVYVVQTGFQPRDWRNPVITCLWYGCVDRMILIFLKIMIHKGQTIIFLSLSLKK